MWYMGINESNNILNYYMSASQTKCNVILFSAPEDRIGDMSGDIQTRERLGGLLKFYYRDGA